MRKIKQALRLASEDLSQRKIAMTLGISRDVVSEYLRRARAAGIDWPEADTLDDNALEDRLFPSALENNGKRKPEPNYQEVYWKLKKKGATLAVIHEDFLEKTPDGIGYSLFCERFEKFRKKLRYYLQRIYKAGEVAFVDYVGPKIPIHISSTEIRHAQVFIGVMGASSYNYWEASWTQQLDDFISSNIRMLEFFGGVPEFITPDNLKSGVKRASKTDPEINDTYQNMADHYGTCILPARPYEPTDKGPVENAVKVFEQRVLFRLHDRIFTSLEELNTELRTHLIALNDRTFRDLPDCTRRSQFEALDKPALKPLRAARYEIKRFVLARVSRNYRVEYDGNRYSVPYQLIDDQVTLHVTATIIEVVAKGKRVASHIRSYEQGKEFVEDAHMPPEHLHYERWTSDDCLELAETVGPCTHSFMKLLFSNAKHKTQGYRQAVAFKKLLKQFTPDRIEAAAKIALQFNTDSVKRLCTILESCRDTNSQNTEELVEAVFDHEFARGPAYYH
jgi:transposase